MRWFDKVVAEALPLVPRPVVRRVSARYIAGERLEDAVRLVQGLNRQGMSATLEDWLMAAEYVMAGGNYQVILCERGVRTFSDHSRNTLDLGVIPPTKALCHLPLFVDPSHATGKWYLVEPVAIASVGAGADGLIIEVHPDPDHALSDGPQSLTPANFEALMQRVRAVSDTLGHVLHPN